MSVFIIPNSGTYYGHFEFTVVKSDKQNAKIRVTVFDERHKRPVYVTADAWPSGNKLTLPPGNYCVRAVLFLPRLDGSIIELYNVKTHYCIIQKNADDSAMSSTSSVRLTQEELSSNNACTQKLRSLLPTTMPSGAAPFSAAFAVASEGEEGCDQPAATREVKPDPLIPPVCSAFSRVGAPEGFVAFHEPIPRESYMSTTGTAAGHDDALCRSRPPSVCSLDPAVIRARSEASREGSMRASPFPQPLQSYSAQPSQHATPARSVNSDFRQSCNSTPAKTLYAFSVRSCRSTSSAFNVNENSLRKSREAPPTLRPSSQSGDGIGARRSSTLPSPSSFHEPETYESVNSYRKKVPCDTHLDGVSEGVSAEVKPESNALKNIITDSNQDLHSTGVSRVLSVKSPKATLHVTQSIQRNEICRGSSSLNASNMLCVESPLVKGASPMAYRGNGEGGLIRFSTCRTSNSTSRNELIFLVPPPSEIDIHKPFSFALALGNIGTLPSSNSLFLNVMLEEEKVSNSGSVPPEPIISVVPATLAAIPALARGLSSPWVCSPCISMDERRGIMELLGSSGDGMRNSMAISTVCVGPASSGLALSGIQFVYEKSEEMKSYQFFLAFCEIEADDEEMGNPYEHEGSPKAEGMRFSSIDDRALGAEIIYNSLPYIRCTTDENGEMVLEVHRKGVVVALEPLPTGSSVTMYFGVTTLKNRGDQQQAYISVLVNYHTLFCHAIRDAKCPEVLRVILMSNVESTEETSVARLHEVEFLTHHRRLVAFAEHVTLGEEGVSHLKGLKEYCNANITAWVSGEHPGISAQHRVRVV